jgi:hypothetical protein
MGDDMRCVESTSLVCSHPEMRGATETTIYAQRR